ncbi:DUF5602 domain-containing protein [Flavobacterium sp. SM15]|uniref:DUF5602 domain-containing protein n=1 Tax=Flavobacterium sp. SM15 TaxID=2908005 RepID=UPI001EDAADD4|nr:DUF5602 domain-containing protein [Flavobacterium sp. SM15]MCG2610482.1 DUF5602 domain-containing protein [Flavobacterium sp. SM15]
MEKIYRFRKLLPIVLLLLYVSCDKEEMIPNDSDKKVKSETSFESRVAGLSVFKGPEVNLGRGKIRSWISINSQGEPEELGVEMTPNALRGLPVESEHSHTIVVPLHLKAKQITPFDHIGLNWNPNGHEPEGVFDVPHFDLHFYMISVKDREAIPAWSPETDALFNNYPPRGYMPQDYFTPPGPATAEAQMGKHWLPVNLGDFLPFKSIMIYGSYDGRVIFYEPMFTYKMLTNPFEGTSRDFSVPSYYQTLDSYPSTYNIYKDEDTGKIYISMSNFLRKIR